MKKYKKMKGGAADTLPDKSTGSKVSSRSYKLGKSVGFLNTLKTYDIRIIPISFLIIITAFLSILITIMFSPSSFFINGPQIIWSVILLMIIIYGLRFYVKLKELNPFYKGLKLLFILLFIWGLNILVMWITWSLCCKKVVEPTDPVVIGVEDICNANDVYGIDTFDENCQEKILLLNNRLGVPEERLQLEDNLDGINECLREHISIKKVSNNPNYYNCSFYNYLLNNDNDNYILDYVNKDSWENLSSEDKRSIIRGNIIDAINNNGIPCHMQYNDDEICRDDNETIHSEPIENKLDIINNCFSSDGELTDENCTLMTKLGDRTYIKHIFNFS